jgi:beta-glucanase (GH16 family)
MGLGGLHCRAGTHMVAVFALLLTSLAGPTAAFSSFCAGAGWSQVWSDEFSGSAHLNTSAWTVDLNAGDSHVRNSQETLDNVYLEGGHLVLRSQRQKSGKWNYTSGAVATKGKVSWKGLTRACVSAKLPGGEGPPAHEHQDWCATTPVGKCQTGCQPPKFPSRGVCGPDKKPPPAGKSCNHCLCNKENTTCGPSPKRTDSQGVWPAHWMMPDNGDCWPSGGEIDIMEMVDGDGVTQASYHWNREACSDACRNGTQGCRLSIGAKHPDPTDTSVFHEYAVEYSKDHIHYAFGASAILSLTAWHASGALDTRNWPVT